LKRTPTKSAALPLRSPQGAGVAVAAAGEALKPAAGELAASLALPLVAIREAAGRFDLLLLLTSERLELRSVHHRSLGAVSVDFVHGPAAYRRIAAGGRRQPLARAVGLRTGRPTVLDATVGLGRDAFLLACLGCRVTGVERSPVITAMLRDALNRATRSGLPALCDAVRRITVIGGDSRDLMRGLDADQAPDVVYIDPMYPPGRKTAAVKKEMRICRLLVGDDPDAAELFDVARRVARRRVVVKRHRHANPLGPDPSLSYSGRVVRYDVYITSADEGA